MEQEEYLNTQSGFKELTFHPRGSDLSDSNF